MAMMKASINGRYDGTDGNSSTACTFDFNGGGEVKLRASLTDATFVAGPSFHGLSVAVEKPGSFLVGYDFMKKDVKFQFMNTVKVSGKPLNLVYTHMKGDNKTALDGTLVIDSANKLSANYAFDSRNCKIKYTYLHGDKMTIEPCYDLGKNSWDFAVSQKIYDHDIIKATYQTSSRVLGLDWISKSKFAGGVKISATFDLADEVKLPKLTAETAWNFEV